MYSYILSLLGLSELTEVQQNILYATCCLCVIICLDVFFRFLLEPILAIIGSRRK